MADQVLTPDEVQERLDQVTSTLGDPPNVHERAPKGVWSTGRSCYEFLARTVPPDAVTLETGLGVSTVLFSLWSRHHVCNTFTGDEVDALERWARDRDHDLRNVRFEVGPSDRTLPQLQIDPIDVFFIDGGHGFPTPIIDWYYGSLHLRPGGFVVVDDVQLPSVHDFLIRFLREDDRWAEVAGDDKWLAFQKLGDFDVREEWTHQTFLGGRTRPPLRTRSKRAGYRWISRLPGYRWVSRLPGFRRLSKRLFGAG